jgi:hypothetical protein
MARVLSIAAHTTYEIGLYVAGCLWALPEGVTSCSPFEFGSGTEADLSPNQFDPCRALGGIGEGAVAGHYCGVERLRKSNVHGVVRC